MTQSNLAIGVDIGGTHITAALVNPDDRKIIPGSVTRATLNARGSADEVIGAWSACITAAGKSAMTNSVCIAMPGPFDYMGGISKMRGQDKYESLYGLNIKERLGASLRISPAGIFIDNDAACFLQGEVFSGSARSYADSTVIGITLGTGLGSACFRNNRSRSADKWCWPFRDGIAEDYLCTRWFVQRWKEETGEVVHGVRELVDRADTDLRVQHVFDEFSDHLANFLLDFIAIESPAAVVIGGNIAKAWERFSPGVMSTIYSKHPEVSIERAILGEQAALLGAVSSWLQYERALHA